ncbi:hypothetical protein AB9F29_15095 [Falsihalocynthiibacter sp. S25ZX9]|uniref:hypothetical protein n=1 Tax=Falsihalocynthiibacter sp. S25ZX9 TaxID=3240870 RepID=UPI0035107F22
MRKFLPILGCSFLLSACVSSSDPADGGFFNGVQGISSGGYDARIDEREQAVVASQSRNSDLRAEEANLQAQIKASESDLAKLKFTILQQKNALSGMDPQTSARVNAVLNAKPTGATDQSKLAALQKTISDAKALSAELAKLAA